MFRHAYVRWPTGAKHNSISLLKHNNLSQDTTIVFKTQQSFSEHNNLSQNARIFYKTQQSFSEYNNLSQYTTIFFKTQHDFLIHNSKLKHNRNWRNTTKFQSTGN